MDVVGKYNMEAPGCFSRPMKFVTMHLAPPEIQRWIGTVLFGFIWSGTIIRSISISKQHCILREGERRREPVIDYGYLKHEAQLVCSSCFKHFEWYLQWMNKMRGVSRIPVVGAWGETPGKFLDHALQALSNEGNALIEKFSSIFGHI